MKGAPCGPGVTGCEPLGRHCHGCRTTPSPRHAAVADADDAVAVTDRTEQSYSPDPTCGR